MSKKDKKNKDEKRKKGKKLGNAEAKKGKAEGGGRKSEQDEKGVAAAAVAGDKPASLTSTDAGSQKLTGKMYAKELEKLHAELVKLQEWVKFKGLKVCVIFEGRDGAGKGGTIKAISERVSPRVFRVVALPAPTDREKSQMYLQRYVTHLPAAGEIFDRSWYNRAGVERVMGFTPEETVKKFLAGVPLVEKAIVDSGIVLLKYWLEVSPEEQTRRLTQRIDDGRKIWKLSPMDLKSYSRWYEYSRARDEMFAATDSGFAPCRSGRRRATTRTRNTRSSTCPRSSEDRESDDLVMW